MVGRHSVWCRQGPEYPKIGNFFQDMVRDKAGVLFDWIESFDSREDFIDAIPPTREVTWNFQNGLEGKQGSMLYNQVVPMRHVLK